MLERVRKPEDIAFARREAALRHPLLRLVGRDEVEYPASVWHEAFPGVAFRTMASGPEMMLTLLRIDRGAAVPVHHHRAAQVGYVLEGSIRLTTPDGQRTVPPGECYVVPPGVSHQIRALDSAAVLDAFAPGFGDAPEAGLFAGDDAGIAESTTECTRRPRRRARRLPLSAAE